MAVPLIDFGVIKKGSLSPCLTKKSSELRRAAGFGNAASEPLQNPALSTTQISNILFHAEVSLKHFANQKAGTQGMCQLWSSGTFPFANPSRLLFWAVAEQANSKPSTLYVYQTPSHWRHVVQQWIFWRKSFYCSGPDYLQLPEVLKIQLPLLNFGISKC